MHTWLDDRPILIIPAMCMLNGLANAGFCLVVYMVVREVCHTINKYEITSDTDLAS